MSEFDQEERNALANMVMRSLRGSWGHPYEERAEFLRDLAESGLSDYDEEKVISKVDHFLEGTETDDLGTVRDGRTFRYIYEDGPRVAEQTDEQTAKSLVGHIPAGDMTWDANAIERRFSDE